MTNEVKHNEESVLTDLLSDKVVRVDTYCSKPVVNISNDKVRIILDLTLPDDARLYRIFKKLIR